MSAPLDADEAYRRTQSQIYNLQETILNSTKSNLEQQKDVDQSHGQSLRTKHTTVGCTKVFEYLRKHKYIKDNEPPAHLGTLYYNSFKTGSFEHVQPQEPLTDLSMPPPFLPTLTSDHVYHLLTIEISYEHLESSFQRTVDAPRASNNEIWGCNIYSDDSDPILVLRHCGLHLNCKQNELVTPGNEKNLKNVEGIIPPTGTPFDVELDIIILPTLENYVSIKKNGIHSRAWGTDAHTETHDGLSYAIYRIGISPRDTSTKNIHLEHDIGTSNWH